VLRNLDSVRNTPLDTPAPTPVPKPLSSTVSVAPLGRLDEEEEEEEEDGEEARVSATEAAVEDWSKELNPSTTSALRIASLTAGLRLLPPTSTTSFMSSAAGARSAVCVVPLSPCDSGGDCNVRLPRLGQLVTATTCCYCRYRRQCMRQWQKCECVGHCGSSDGCDVLKISNWR
jgi:hypothetical protein